MLPTPIAHLAMPALNSFQTNKFINDFQMSSFD